MIPTPAQDTLPLALTPAFTPVRAASPAPGPGWQRVLAQAAQAMHAREDAALLARPGLASRPVLPPKALPAEAGMRAAATGAWQAPAAIAQEAFLSPARVAAAKEQVGASAQALSQATRPDSPGVDAPAEAETSAPPSRPRHSAPADRTPSVHVHVERQAEGLAVFLGIPGDAAGVAAHSAALLAELRRQLHGPAHRLALVVCNGVALHTLPSLSKEQP